MPLPACVGDSVCAMLQSGPSGLSSVGVCACAAGAECDSKWDEAQTRERDRWITRHVNQEDITEMYREGWIEEQFKVRVSLYIAS